ncbi:MAG: alanine racemase [Spirochaetes bacterium]|nr:alanine racemase [Spirochaetota bacterium]
MNKPNRCWAEVNLSSIKKNLDSIKKRVKKSGIMAVIKADAYGHGVIEIAKLLKKSQIRNFAVATVDEGIELRSAGFIDEEILILGSFFKKDLEAYYEAGLTPSINSLENITDLDKFAKKKDTVISCHLKVDTGMNRYGFYSEYLIKKHELIFRLTNINITAIYSHLSSSTSQVNEFTNTQIDEYKRLCDFLELNNIWFGKKHLLNSGGIIHYPEYGYDYVRPGLSLYGYYPGTTAPEKLKLNPSMSLNARIVEKKNVLKGRSVGYNRTFTAKSDMMIAILPIGYADGVSTRFSNNGYVQIAKDLCPIIGRVCMDTIMVDITGIKVKRGAVATIWGGNNSESVLSLEKVSKTIDSIPYELTCNVSKRVPRIYVK